MADQSESRVHSSPHGAMLERVLALRGGALRRTALTNAASQADAEDALQDGYLAFLRFYEGGEDGALPWLRLVVKRFAWAMGDRSRHRGSHRHVVTVETGEPTGGEIVLADPRTGTEELVERAEETERRLELLGRLKPDERTVLILIGLGASYREIGELRGWSQTKINRCASEGRARLQELMAAEGERT